MGFFKNLFKGTAKQETGKETVDRVVAKAEKVVASKSMGLNLSKRVAESTEKLGLCLAKNKMENVKARVQVAMDESGSMEWAGLYSKGFVQRTFERLMPIGLKFDDNKSLECYTFCTKFREHADITIKNLDGYVKNEIGRITNGATKYAPVINAMVKRHVETQIKTGDGLPTFVIMITDGENSDHAESRKALIEASKHNIFFMFIGIGEERFSFLQELDDMAGREKDNADFEPIKNIDNLTDEKLYSIMFREFKDFVK